MEENKQEQFMLLYRPLHERFERFCKARAYGELDFRDLMHDTLLIAFEKFDRIKSMDAFLYFLFGTAVRVLSNHKRKNKPDLTENFSEKYSHIQSDAKSAELELEIKELYHQLGKLDTITRECIILWQIDIPSNPINVNKINKYPFKSLTFKKLKKIIYLQSQIFRFFLKK